VTAVPERLSAALADRYRIERELGQGGMATVYLAQDLKHQRRVAIKVLKPELAAVLGAERFVQEITTTAQLQHPHILPLFDSGQADGFLYYVMPYIEGETLRTKLDREHQLGVDEAVKITTEVADALDYAHRHGVIHRDIKPENILLHDGRPMVADFGIALAVSAAAGGRLTETGLSLGTPHYMSPEQATAEKDITGRSDIYSLASVLYEMLTGDPPHVGSSAQQIIMKIVTDAPRPVTELRKSVPPNVAAALSKALEKLPADRFDTAKSFADALANPTFRIAAAPSRASPTGRSPDRRTALLAATAFVAIAFAALFVWSLGRTPTSAGREPITFTFRPGPPAPSRPDIDISPDGRRIIVPVPDSAGVNHLVARDLATPGLQVIPGTEDATAPQFSADGKWILFSHRGDRHLFRIPATGGTPVTVADSTGNLAWESDGWIVYTRVFGGLWRVRESGGAPQRVTTLDTARHELTHWTPQVLPGGTAAIFSSFTTPLSRSQIEAVEFASGRVTTLVRGAGFGRYVDGYLLYVRDGAIFAAPFDAARLRVLGPASPVVEDVAWSATSGAAGFAVAGNGTLAYLKASQWNVAAQVVWVDRSGHERPALPVTGQFAEPRLSPDGRWIALTRLDPTRQIWLFDRQRQLLSQLTHSAGVSFDPLWSHDGRAVFHAVETPLYDIARTALDGSSDTILVTSEDKYPDAESPDGRLLAYSEWGAARRIVLAPLGDSSAPRPPDDRTSRWNAAFSPDGRWLAFTADGGEGLTQVYVAPVTGSGRRQVSAGGGSQPRWTRGGREIVFRNGDAMLAASFNPATGEAGAPGVLFRKTALGSVNSFTVGYDVTPDGAQFLMVVPVERPDAQFAVVIVNWLEALRQRMPR
jgi:serine/threonine protein kinase/Tol biopolymer transport system component